MLNEPAEHECYQELCTLAASGLATASELEHLDEHLKLCPKCSQFLADISDLTVLLSERSETIFASDCKPE